MTPPRDRTEPDEPVADEPVADEPVVVPDPPAADAQPAEEAPAERGPVAPAMYVLGASMFGGKYGEAMELDSNDPEVIALSKPGPKRLLTPYNAKPATE